MPYRIASPPEPDPPEVEEPYAAVLRRERRRARIVSALVLGSAVVGVFATARVARSQQSAPAVARLTDRERSDSAHFAIDSARRRAAEQQDRFAANIRDAIRSNVGPDPAAGVCPIAFAKEESVRGMTTARRFPLLVVRESDLANALPSQAVAEVLSDTSRAEKHITAGHFEEATLYARALDRADRFGVEVVLVTKDAEPAHVLSNGAFAPGHVHGRAYLYDFASGRVACAADVEAHSSKSVGYVYSDHADAPTWLGATASLDDAIDADLHHNTESAIITAMQYRVAPH